MLRNTLACLALALPLSALATDDLTVANAWARATVPGQEVGAAYLDLTSTGGARLEAASSPIAASMEIHTMSVKDGVMQMRALAGLDLPAGQTVQLAPNGNHLMFIGLKQPLKAGEQVEIRLELRTAKGRATRKLSVPVRPLTDAGGHDTHHHH